ncbi:hypothetical protein GCM10009560_48870 [Nonomuraea longicatena]|uniref:Uncharacterized protein n=1 Tax=Nonomuraea longicatena TaxID=83682 RepID=A0ABN1Q7K9_9ACTN
MPDGEVLEIREGTRLSFVLPRVAPDPHEFESELTAWCGSGTGKTSLVAHLVATILKASAYYPPREAVLFALTSHDSGKTWALPSTWRTCDSCVGGRDLEASLADFQRSRRFLPLHRNPLLTTCHDLLYEREPLSPFDPVPQVDCLFEDGPPPFSSCAAHPCALSPILLVRKVHPDHQEMLVQLLNRVIRIIRLVRKLMATHLRRLSHVPTFGLLMMAAMLRYGHRHDSDDDLHSPLRRCMITAGGATSI